MSEFFIYLCNGILISEFVFGALIAVGWLCCANYYFYIEDIITNVGIGIIYLYLGIFAFLSIVLSLMDGWKGFTFISIIGTILTGIVLIVCFIVNVVPTVLKLRQYFANKRGRRI
ncbi:putative membrane protein [Erwinia phage pEa_SNUABM_50]|uniref:Uncharacterized protein n=4 Tax=Eneladusvirus BF TaxID=2560751 RepID=A0A1S6UBE3_9CAUD|nr:membrane protein [Serratia phage BF]QOI71416.1 putative membrane protein [Erwinia phage pEa_SNUABM_12]QOI72007.1 putative membrane protein [Erwinia phage pEa_SNUABM_47]QOI72547.1 putative membrane protein [Erwinia phage pEa_SNUABM_50]QXO11680.1 hypothetical protein pEaSNUABM19_00569 [Erwinia phage pEa_SNUABM_19]QXO12229.1 hypothetical protein pEaSNUABM44_00568 [Erwinia phage pEa_SNUABM_44]QXO12783.1 hypothetical protein pEaSNUABM49_00570 [Erwinia phage pEa_SNUABM_49]